MLWMLRAGETAMNFFTRIWNEFNKVILNTSMHGLTSKKILLIQFRGRKSGLEYTTPVNYTQQGDSLRITSFIHRKWWRNLETHPDVVVTVRGHKIQGTAEVFVERDDVSRELGIFLMSAPEMAKFFKVRQTNGNLNQADLFKTADQRVMIKVHLSDPVT